MYCDSAMFSVSSDSCANCALDLRWEGDLNTSGGLEVMQPVKSEKRSVFGSSV